VPTAPRLHRGAPPASRPPPPSASHSPPVPLAAWNAAKIRYANSLLVLTTIYLSGNVPPHGNPESHGRVLIASAAAGQRSPPNAPCPGREGAQTRRSRAWFARCPSTSLAAPAKCASGSPCSVTRIADPPAGAVGPAHKADFSRVRVCPWPPGKCGATAPCQRGPPPASPRLTAPRPRQTPARVPPRACKSLYDNPLQTVKHPATQTLPPNAAIMATFSHA
jgi:hypothetical protein